MNAASKKILIADDDSSVRLVLSQAFTRLGYQVRATGNASDLMILLVLYAQLILGLSTIVASTHHLDGSVMVMLADWAQSVVTLQPLAAAEAIAPVSLVYKLHVMLGLTLFVLFPFTRLVHIVSAPVWYLGRRYQVVRQKSRAA